MPTPHPHEPQIEIIARAFILHQSHVLMCRNTAAEYFYLPGGHIEFAEPASKALERELLEETATKIAVGPLLLTTENTFNDGQKDHHEINLIFQAHLEIYDKTQLFRAEQLGSGDPAAPTPASVAPATEISCPEIQSQESHIDFAWIDLAAVTDLDIRPTQIKAWLATGGQTPTPTSPAGSPADSPASSPANFPVGSSADSLTPAPHLADFEIPFPTPIN